VSIGVRAASMTIDIDRAIPAGLILNELVSNCFKHGFSDGRAGRIDVTLQLRDGNEATLAVKDDGAGVPAGFDPSSSDSLGLRLVHMLANQLGGSLSFKYVRGFSCELVFARKTPPQAAAPSVRVDVFAKRQGAG